MLVDLSFAYKLYIITFRLSNNWEGAEPISLDNGRRVLIIEAISPSVLAARRKCHNHTIAIMNGCMVLGQLSDYHLPLLEIRERRL